jgi:hypothetical protein
MKTGQVRTTRRVAMRIHAEEVRRFHADVVVEVPVNASDEQLERMWSRQFDVVREVMDWEFDCTTGIWPSNCGRRIQPQVRGAVRKGERTQICLERSPKGSLLVKPAAAVDASLE